jgi:hypothetical protein
VESIVMRDETWVHKFVPKPKRNSMTWKHPHSPTTKYLKLSYLGGGQPCSGIVKASCCEFLAPKTTINSYKYCKTFGKLGKASTRKRPRQLTAGVRLLQDGTQPYTSVQTVAWL